MHTITPLPHCLPIEMIMRFPSMVIFLSIVSVLVRWLTNLSG